MDSFTRSDGRKAILCMVSDFPLKGHAGPLMWV